MLHFVSCLATALVVGSPAAHRGTSRAVEPVMMPKFLKTLFPNLEKPDFGSAPAVDPTGPNPAIKLAGKAMPLLGPVFSLEADLQAIIFNLGTYDADAVQADISKTIKSAPVVIYSYGLSPFSTEAIAVLESTGARFENVQLGLEWFALGPKASATRVQLRKMYGQGSLPHIFIGGEWVGGLATGANGGLSGLVERGELMPMLKKARAI